MTIPAQQLKAAADGVAIPTAILAWLKAITIPDAAALAALIYTLLRIGEFVYLAWKKWRNK